MSEADEGNVFEWSTPPNAPARQGGSGRTVSAHWQSVAEALTANPNEWAKVAEHEKMATAQNHSARIRNGKSRAFKPQHFEAVARVHNGHPAVFARYVGAPAAVEATETVYAEV